MQLEITKSFLVVGIFASEFLLNFFNVEKSDFLPIFFGGKILLFS
jgi:hypothetical protein